MDGSGGTDRDRPVVVHGRWTMPAPHPRPSLEATLSTAGDGWVLHHGGPESATLLGWTTAELRAVSADNLLHPDDRDRLDEVAAGVAGRSDAFVPLDLRILARDSRYWWTLWHLALTADGSAELHGTDVLGPDRDPARAPLVATWRWNVETDAVSWSPELLDIFAMHVGPPASFASFLATVHDDDRAHVERHLRRAVRDGDPFRYTFRCPTEGTRDRVFHAVGRCGVDGAGSRQVIGLVKYLNPPSSGATQPVIGCG